MLTKPKVKRKIYLDHAATTYTDERVVKAMLPYFSKIYGNPSSLHQKGIEANGVLNDCRRTISKLISALPENIIFTSGGTESDNLAIYGAAFANQHKGKHIISTPIEHHAVLHPLDDLKKQGWDITYLKVDKNGFVKPEEVIKAIRPDTVLISVMYANNEIGTIEPIAEIGRELLKYRKENNSVFPYFHTDACQAAGYLDLNVEKLHVDLMTINGSKIYGPKGIGMLYMRRGVSLKPIISGGGQERHLRAGTENLSSIVGFAKALEFAQTDKEKESERISELKKYFWSELQASITNIKLNGPEFGENRLPNNLNVAIAGTEGEALMLYLDEYGVMCSTGSACTSESIEPSHVLTAIGLSYDQSHSSLRFSLGHCNTKEDIDYIIKYIPEIIQQLREVNPVNSKLKS